MEIFREITPSLLLIVKIAVLVFLFLYVIFASIVVRQVKVMTEALRVGFEFQIKLVAFLHFVVSVLVFIFSFFTL